MRRYIFSDKTTGLETLDFDVLIIGSGIAGLYAGLHIDPSKRTAIVSKADFALCSSWLAQGGIAAVIDKNLLTDDGSPTWQYFAQRIKENFIAGDLLQVLRQIEAEFDTVIGIPNANTDKRERLITDEVNANNIETQSRARLWLDTIRADLEKVNKMFGLNVGVDFRFKAEETEVFPDDQSDTVNNGAV